MKLKPATLRKLHTYVSLVIVVVLILYAVTGILLNHPDLFEASGSHSSVEISVLPPHGLSSVPELSDMGLTEKEYSELYGGDSVSRKTPGRAVDIYYSDNILIIDESDYGWVQSLVDYHKNRNAPEYWVYISDVISLFVIFISVIGIAISIKNKKKRSRYYQILFGSTVLIVTGVII